LVEIDLDWIDTRVQPRTVFDEPALQTLAQSIREHGLKQPVLVRQETSGRYTLVAGERRFRAHRINGSRTIVAIVVKDDDLDATALIENMQRVDLDAVDLAVSVRQLIARHGYTQEQVAPFIGATSHTQVSRLLKILRLPEPILVDYRSCSDRVSRATLMEIAEVDDPARQSDLWDQAKSGLGSKHIRERKRAVARPGATDGQALRAIAQAMVKMAREIETLTTHRGVLARDHVDRLRTLRNAIDGLLDGH
jgi:ParB family chromosome partitioning protein